MISGRLLGKTKYKNTTIFICLLFCVLFLFVPHRYAASELSQVIAARFVNTEDQKLVFFDYKAYGTKRVFNDKKNSYIAEKKDYLKSKNEIAVVKITGEHKIVVQWDYVVIYDESVPELNVEIYIAKNLDFYEYSVPCKTVLLFLSEIFYCIIVCIYCLAVFICLVKTIKNGVFIKCRVRL